ncbi:DNA-binding transcriptional regulator, MocR family, contains an aminotransferase domain [Rhizobium sp. RU35A]|nr:DNA-binding transcriptional regulator, MocR family, contains an aminotransferase domain [Rhizobium sp. RU35A]
MPTASARSAPMVPDAATASPSSFPLASPLASPLGRTRLVMETIRLRIAARALGPGDRLPSIRGLAASLGVSPSTVVEAYDRLAAEGQIRARRGAGFFVASGAAPPLSLTEMQSPAARAVDPFWVTRQSLDAVGDRPKPGCGWLPAEWMPEAALRKALRQVARGETRLLMEYSPTLGAPSLRRVIAARLAEEGLAAPPEQILLTTSATQALDLICRLLLRPGDPVLVDDPCFFNFQALLKAHQARILSVPFLPGGPDPAAFEAVVARERPRLYLTNAALHNPTGASLLPQVAHRIVASAARYDMPIVEDDIFADYEPDPSPRLAALDGLSNVIRIGSFSKTISASLRTGYIAARADWIAPLTDLQVAGHFSGPSPFVAEVLAELLTGGSYRKHLDDLRHRLAGARRTAVQMLAPLGISPVLLPRGGFTLWCRLPDGVDAVATAEAALSEGTVLAPGNVFSPTLSAPNLMRFNVTQMTDPRLPEVLKAAMRGS